MSVRCWCCGGRKRVRVWVEEPPALCQNLPVTFKVERHPRVFAHCFQQMEELGGVAGGGPTSPSASWMVYVQVCDTVGGNRDPADSSVAISSAFRLLMQRVNSSQIHCH